MRLPCGARFRFRSGFHLTTPRNSLALVSRRTLQLWSSLRRVKNFFSLLMERVNPFKQQHTVTIQFQALFTPLSGYFSAFARATIRYRSQGIFRVGC